MTLKSLAKKIIPASLWGRMRRMKADHRKMSVMRMYMKSSEFAAFMMLDTKDYERTGKVFDGEQYYSQAYQDYFLDKFIFFRKEGGFFLDIGGNDPIHINNTYFFEKSRSWTGLAFEPMAFQRGKWKTSRKTECLPYALGKSSGEAEFCEYDADYMSGFSDEVDFSGSVKARYKVPVRRLSDILNERGIKHVDLVSLDVEGAEIDVLSGIDFARIDIHCFTIENNKGYEREQLIRRFMTEAGYRIKARLWLDEVWVKK